jgi:hypothetical protein
MAYIVLPWQDFPAYQMTVPLEQTAYVFNFKWNTSFSFWTMDILDPQGDLLIAGLKLVLHVELLRRYQNALLPPGELRVIDTEGALTEISRADMGVFAQLIYRESTTVDAV